MLVVQNFSVKYLFAYASEAYLSCLVPNVYRYFSWLVEIKLIHTALHKYSSVSCKFQLK